MQTLLYIDGVDGCAAPDARAAASLPRLFCGEHVRCVEIAQRLVLLDVSAGTYDVVDEVGTQMWQQLLRNPDERDIACLAGTYGVPSAVIAADLAEFAAAQLAAGRLRTGELRIPPVAPRLPRRRPTVWRALRERAGVEQDLRRGFAVAYDKCTGPVADCAPPRLAVERLVRLFRTADGLYPAREAPLDCLPRSLALTRFLRMSGWPVTHMIGVALDPFEAHAWVELDGHPLDESPTTLLRYVTIAAA